MKQLYDGDHRMFYEAIVVYTALVGYPLRVNTQEWKKKNRAENWHAANVYEPVFTFYLPF